MTRTKVGSGDGDDEEPQLDFDGVRSGPLSKTGDPYTSKLAAALQTGAKVSPTRSSILLAFDDLKLPGGISSGAMTDDDLIDVLVAARVPATPSSIRTRRHELTLAGFLEEAGEGVSPYGNPALRWKLTEAGESYVRRNRGRLIEQTVKLRGGPIRDARR